MCVCLCIVYFICFDCCLPIIEALLTNFSMCINVNVFTYIHTCMNVCGFSHLPAHIHLSFAKCAEMASPKNFSMGIRWAFARILCTAHMHTYTHTRTNTKGMRLGLGLFWAWTRAGPGLGFFSPLPAIASTSRAGVSALWPVPAKCVFSCCCCPLRRRLCHSLEFGFHGI